MLDLTLTGAQIAKGIAGALEVLIDQPARENVGVAVVAHPQPLLGGSATHKVPHYLARALCDSGWLVIRPNFRGVGRSEGAHSFGVGEAEDVLVLVRSLRGDSRFERLALVGFSFGAYVHARVASTLMHGSEAAHRVVLAGMPFGVVGTRRYETPHGLPNALVVHGELDETVPLASVLDWARPLSQPVVVVPGADHFFTGRLPVLRKLVLSHLRS